MAINLGDINFGLGPDTARLTAARREVLRFGQAVDAAANAQGAGARAAEAAMRRQEKAIVDTLNQILKLNDAVRRTGDNPAQLNRTTATFNRLVRELTQGRVSALQFQRSMEDVSTSLGRVQRQAANHRETLRATAEAERAAARASKEQSAQLIRSERVLAQASRAVESYNASVARMRAPGNLTSNANSALGGLRSTLGTPGLDAVAISRASETFRNQMNQNAIALRNFQKHGDQTAVANGMQRLANVSVLMHGPLSGIASRFSLIAGLTDKFSIGLAATVTGVAAAAWGFTNLAKAAIESSKAFDRVNMSLTAVQGSAALNARSMEYLMGVSDRTGRSFADVAGAYARIQAAAKGTNLEGQRTRLIFERVVAAGATMGSTNEEVAGTLRALEQIMSKGSVQAEELRGQLGDRLPGAFNIMADALGVTTEELNKLMKQGKITSDALLPFSEELAKRYGVDLTKSIDTVTSAEGRLANAWMRHTQQLDKLIGFSQAWKNILNTGAGALDAITKFLQMAYTPAEQFGAAIKVNAKALREASGASSSFRGELQAQLVAQKQAAQVALQEARAQLEVAKAKKQANLDRLNSLGNDNNLLDAFMAIGTQAFDDTYNSVDRATGEVDAMAISLKAINDQLQEIEKVRAGMGDNESKPIVPIGDAEATAASLSAMAKAAREAGQEIGKTRAEYQTLLLPPGQQEFVKSQMRINEQVSQFKDRLIDAKIPMEQVNALTTQYRTELGMLEEVQYRLQYFPSIWKELSIVLGEGMDRAMGSTIDAIFAGEDALASLMNTGRMVVQDLIKTFAQLAIINPIKNALFGGNPATGGLFPSWNPMSLFGASNQSTGMFGGGGNFSIGGMASYAGGGSFTIPGGGGHSGMDSQLVQFMGSPGEEVSISKRGHGGSGGETYVEGDTYVIDARESQIGVEDKIMAAIKAYDKTAVVRFQRDAVKAKTRRFKVPG